MAVFRKRQKDSQPVHAMEVMASVMAGLGAAPGQGETRARLQQLWLNWGMVMGPELAPLARPMGHHRDVLLIGAEDAMLAQELHLMAGEMLERVNAVMEQPSPRLRPPEPLCADGVYLEAMDPASPVARAYARFTRQRRTR